MEANYEALPASATDLAEVDEEQIDIEGDDDDVPLLHDEAQHCTPRPAFTLP